MYLKYFVYFYVFLSTSAYARSAIRIETKSGFIEIIPKDETPTTTSTTTRTTTHAQTQKINEKDIKSLLLQMLAMAKVTGKQNDTMKKTEMRTAEKTTTKVGVQKIITNKPEKYTGDNEIIRELCPYFVSNEGFNTEKLPGVYWPRFYNMKEGLKCFKISVTKLTEKQMKDNEITIGTFGGKLNWRETLFEITPPTTVAKRRHFLSGGLNDKGVMRNIMITRNKADEYILQEEAPDQWLMLRNLVLLRDCMTGDVVVFSKFPQQTSSVDVVEVLQDLGEEMTGQMVCDADDDWLRDYYV